MSVNGFYIFSHILLPSARPPLSAPLLDLFCAVVDNYGDIGVCWRLARQLAGERGYRVRLWVDDLKSFARLEPGIDPLRETQHHQGVEIDHWSEDFPDVEPGEVVIEAFACELPERFIAAMAARPTPPRWLNLEYLSAEAWVEGCHGLASPHARFPLLKHFFFPGFTGKTGGLILERGLFEERKVFQAHPAARAEFAADLDLPPRRADELRVSLFSYANVSLLALLEAWIDSSRPITCLVPDGTAAANLVAAEFGVPARAGARFERGGLRLHILPFLRQQGYDRLLWDCDLNFVRGEDSFVRAQWAARPFVWHIYPQEQDAHHDKLLAFMERYLASLPDEAASAFRQFWLAWNGVVMGDMAPAWNAFVRHLPALTTHARPWAEHIARGGDLATRMENFLATGL